MHSFSKIFYRQLMLHPHYVVVDLDHPAAFSWMPQSCHFTVCSLKRLQSKFKKTFQYLVGLQEQSLHTVEGGSWVVIVGYQSAGGLSEEDTTSWRLQKPTYRGEKIFSKLAKHQRNISLCPRAFVKIMTVVFFTRIDKMIVSMTNWADRISAHPRKSSYIN